MARDLNGDDQPDLAVIDDNGVSVLLGKGDGDGTFDVGVSYAAGLSALSVAAGDFNGDGQLDLATANYDTVGTVSVLLNTCVSTGIDLGIGSRDTTAIISWPAPSTGFVLESATNLGAPDWRTAAEVPTTNNGRWEITVSLDQPGRYFRLHKP